MRVENKSDKTADTDGIKYSKEKQGLNEKPNVPAGVKKPKMTMK